MLAQYHRHMGRPAEQIADIQYMFYEQRYTVHDGLRETGGVDGVYIITLMSWEGFWHLTCALRH